VDKQYKGGGRYFCQTPQRYENHFENSTDLTGATRSTSTTWVSVSVRTIDFIKNAEGFVTSFSASTTSGFKVFIALRGSAGAENTQKIGLSTFLLGFSYIKDGHERCHPLLATIASASLGRQLRSMSLRKPVGCGRTWQLLLCRPSSEDVKGAVD
jgi:hypothetical protein